MNINQDSFYDLLLKESFFLLIKPEDNIYSNTSVRNAFFEDLESLVKLGLKNIEISWSNNENWFDFVSDLSLIHISEPTRPEDIQDLLNRSDVKVANYI